MKNMQKQKMMQLRLPESLADEIADAAMAMGMSRTSFVKFGIHDLLTKLKNEKLQQHEKINQLDKNSNSNPAGSNVTPSQVIHSNEVTTNEER